MKKFLVSFLITLTVLTSAVFAFGCGGTKGLVYEISEDESGYVVTGFSEEIEEYPETLEIPAKYKGKTVAKIGAMAFRNITSIKKVILSEGLEEIGPSAFTGCSGIEEFNFPSTIKKYGVKTFYGCKKLPNIVIPEGVEIIPASLIYGCESITEITIPSGVTEINEKAFGKTSITKIILPNTVKTIASKAFMEADKVEEVSIGNGVIELGSFVFDGCTSLKTVTLGTGLRFIDSNAFNNCTSLEGIVIPENVRGMGGNVFKGCTSLKGITLVGAEFKECKNPACGATIAPESIRLGFTTHYHTTTGGWSSSEPGGSLHGHWIFSHDLAIPENAYKFLVTGEARSLHNHALGGQGSYWSYKESTGKYYFKDSLIKEDGAYAGVNADEDIRGWTWDNSTGYFFFKGTKFAWFDD